MVMRVSTCKPLAVNEHYERQHSLHSVAIKKDLRKIGRAACSASMLAAATQIVLQCALAHRNTELSVVK